MTNETGSISITFEEFEALVESAASAEALMVLKELGLA